MSRSPVTASAGVIEASVTNDFGYNLRSEVTTAAMGTNLYGYVHDTWAETGRDWGQQRLGTENVWPGHGVVQDVAAQ